MTTSSFSSERGHITIIIKGKRGKVRKHPVQPKVYQAVKHYLTADGRGFEVDGPLFRPTRNNLTGETDKPLDAATVAQIVERHCGQVGITKNITPHSCRHTSVTNALDNGASVRRVAHFAGHSDVKTTLRYDRGRENLDDNAALRIHFA